MSLFTWMKAEGPSPKEWLNAIQADAAASNMTPTRQKRDEGFNQATSQKEREENANFDIFFHSLVTWSEFTKSDASFQNPKLSSQSKSNFLQIIIIAIELTNRQSSLQREANGLVKRPPDVVLQSPSGDADESIQIITCYKTTACFILQLGLLHSNVMETQKPKIGCLVTILHVKSPNLFKVLGHRYRH